MLIETVKTLFNRDLNKLIQEIESYKDEKTIWMIDKGISNSAGNLCLHLVGNLNHFIGTVIGKTGYVRKRDLEFSLKDIPVAELVTKIDETIAMINESLPKLKEEDLQGEYPLLVFQEKTSIEYFLVHLVAHLSYHLGQVNYHRRMLE